MYCAVCSFCRRTDEASESERRLLLDSVSGARGKFAPNLVCRRSTVAVECEGCLDNSTAGTHLLQGNGRASRWMPLQRIPGLVFTFRCRSVSYARSHTMGGRRSPEDCNRSPAPDPVGCCKMSKRFLLKLCCSVETVTQSCSALSVVYRNSCALVGGAIKRNAKHVLCGRRRIQRGVYEVQEVATQMTVDAICW